MEYNLSMNLPLSSIELRSVLLSVLTAEGQKLSNADLTHLIFVLQTDHTWRSRETLSPRIGISSRPYSSVTPPLSSDSSSNETISTERVSDTPTGLLASVVNSELDTYLRRGQTLERIARHSDAT